MGAPERVRLPGRSRSLGFLAAAATIMVAGVSASVEATHWCSSLSLATSPGFGYAGDKIPFSITVSSAANATVDASIRVRFAWESQTLSWGTMRLAPGSNSTNTFAKVLTTGTGDHGVTITLQGDATGSGEGVTSCPATVRAFRVESLPPPPTIVLSASATSGAAPVLVNFTLSVSDGVPPFTYRWSFGDGGFAAAPSAERAYPSPGVYTVQVVVMDARGRQAVDRIAVSVTAPPPAAEEAAEPPGLLADPAGFASLRGLAAIAALVLLLMAFASTVFFMGFVLGARRSAPAPSASILSPERVPAGSSELQPSGPGPPPATAPSEGPPGIPASEPDSASPEGPAVASFAEMVKRLVGEREP